MKTFKKMRARANVAKANLDAAILGLRNASLDQLMVKLEETRMRFELDHDLAWSIASGVLAKVKAIRESLQNQPSKNTTKSTRKKTQKIKAVAKKAAVHSRGVAKLKSKKKQSRKVIKIAKATKTNVAVSVRKNKKSIKSDGEKSVRRN